MSRESEEAVEGKIAEATLYEELNDVLELILDLNGDWKEKAQNVLINIHEGTLLEFLSWFSVDQEGNVTPNEALE
jgi:hypothetical protein